MNAQPTTAEAVREVPLSLFRATTEGMAAEPIDLRALTTAGRSGVAAHFLYDTGQTGPDGPAAALVRYEPGAAAPRHEHTGYEIIQVLDGELQTEHGRYPTGSLLVMTPGSTHSPRSAEGCTLLVVWERPVRPA